MKLSPLAVGYDHFLLDLDGCVWIGDEVIDGTIDAVAALRRGGKRVAFVTNNARRGSEEFVRKLWSLGIQASLEEVVTVGGALQHVLAERHAGSTAVVIGSPAIHRHVIDAGLRIVNGSDFITRAQVVVVAGHDDFDYRELREAMQALRSGAVLLGANRDSSFPMPGGYWPGTGAILAAVEVAAGATAETFGKPEPGLFLTALDRLGPGRALVVGDRLDTDLAGAHAAGLDGALVLSGATTKEAAEAAGEPQPVAVGETLADLVLA
ncbi:MAG: HAD-IIA family hydrolase [Solirubrobacteraceae bacterium]